MVLYTLCASGSLLHSSMTLKWWQRTLAMRPQRVLYRLLLVSCTVKLVFYTVWQPSASSMALKWWQSDAQQQGAMLCVGSITVWLI
jgi:hypothetical protein